jgi:hypothetical protein
VKKEMRDYFDRLQKAWQETQGSLPMTPWDETADPLIYVGEPGEDEWVAWQPKEKTVVHRLDKLEKRVGVSFHPSIHEYFNSYWFCLFGGVAGGYAVSLLPVVPGAELDAFTSQVLGAAAQCGGKLERIPIGFERNGLPVVVDNKTGQVGVEDWESGEVTPLASGLAELISVLNVDMRGE